MVKLTADQYEYDLLRYAKEERTGRCAHRDYVPAETRGIHWADIPTCKAHRCRKCGADISNLDLVRR